ncbi:MAG: serine O-acetyltransferase EpsC [Brevinematales bacterium]
MDLNAWLNKDLPSIAQKLENINLSNLINENTIGFAGKEAVYKIIRELRGALFPGAYDEQPFDKSRLNIIVGNLLREAAIDLSTLLEKTFEYYCLMGLCEKCDCKAKAADITIALMDNLPLIRAMLEDDITAAYNGDPAAKLKEEIILSYPSVEALSIYRIAHFLCEKDVPVIPRIMSEYAHQKTGIDIHPGAKIGSSFFIDHGTGTVIGETCTIGNNVKLYQGVTLGAKSFPLDADGHPVKDLKRHPDIEDNVIIYSGTTILGGETRIGHDSVIGGNVWLTYSVPPYTTVYGSQSSPIVKPNRKAAKTPA